MRRGTLARLGALVAVVALLAAACQRGEDAPEATDEEEPQAQQEGGLLQEIRERGMLRCGVNNTVPGFGFETSGGEIEGFDVDFCTAIAAAVFNTPDVEGMIELFPVDAEERFNALRAGEYDVLVRNTTWTSSRDGSEGVAFAHVNFYDGQAMMVREGEFNAVDEMDGTSVCVTTGTTTELNLADYAAQVGVDIEPVTFAENPQLQEAFISGRCDGWTSDRSQLAGIRSAWPDEEGGPESLVILDDIMSKEPLAPGVLDGDQEWYDAVNWVVNGLILAEELGVDSSNVEQQAENPDDPQIAALLGVSFEAETETITVESGLGLEDDFMQAVLQAVGNYGEIFDRHIGPDSPLGLDRGVNALWTDGGIQYAMPFR
ncbi:MAG TPA: amino acid ABC transporter substrate-binding protein [Actinomycetota bacterium]